MVWTIEDCPREGNHVELGDTVQVYLLLLGGEMPGAQLVVEDDVAGVFQVMFPIDADDVHSAYGMLIRHANHPKVPIYATTELTCRDTNLPMLKDPGDSKVLQFFYDEEGEH